MITLNDEEYARLKEMADYQIPRKPSLESDWCADGHNVLENSQNLREKSSEKMTV